MQWIEVTVGVSSKNMDLMCSELTDIGVQGFVIESEEEYRRFLEDNRQYWDYIDEELDKKITGLSRIKFYLTNNAEGSALLMKIRSIYPDYEISSALVKDEDWENNWRQYYKPMKVGKKLLIVPEWETVENCDGRALLKLDPGLIFGTGSHPTTRMCLEALEDIAQGAKVLDLGCGSGILAIAALILGAESAVCCDVDEKAPNIVHSNAALSGVNNNITVFAGDIISDLHVKKKIGTGYDLVLANIVSDVIIPLSSDICAYMNPLGTFICSGIIDGRENDVSDALINNGLRILEQYHIENWHAYKCQLK